MLIKSEVSTGDASKSIRVSEETSAGVNDEGPPCDWLQIRAATHISTQELFEFAGAGGERRRRARDRAPQHQQINIGTQQPLPRSAGTPISASNRAATRRRRLWKMRDL